MTVIITGRERSFTDVDGNRTKASPAIVLMHEMVGHGIPALADVGRDTGNAVDNENKVREELRLKKRQA